MKPNGPFRKPEQIADEITEQVCGAPKRSVAAWLKSEAKKNNCSLSHLVGQILNDYARWAKEDKS